MPSRRLHVTTGHDHTPCPHFEKSILATAPFCAKGVDRANCRSRPAKLRHLRHGMHDSTRCRLPWQGIRADARARDSLACSQSLIPDITPPSVVKAPAVAFSRFQELSVQAQGYSPAYKPRLACLQGSRLS